ncbi:hypothetical protein JCM10212_006639 [Sporobolomyces blumeae]
MSAPPLKQLLEAASALVGLSPRSTRPTSKLSASGSTTLAEILASRLDLVYSLSSVAEHLPPRREPHAKEQELQHATADVALALLELISTRTRTSVHRSPHRDNPARPSESSAPSPSPSSSTSSARTPAAPPRPSSALPPPPPPLFGTTDAKVLSQVASVASRWGIASSVEEKVLPAQLTGSAETRRKGSAGTRDRAGGPVLVNGGKGKGKAKEADDARFLEVDDEAEERKRCRLGKFVDGLVEVLHGRATVSGEVESDDTKQFRAIVGPQVLLSLIGGVAQLESSDATDSDKIRHGRQLQLMLSSYPLPALLSALLTLLSASSPTSRHRAALTSHLTSLLLRPTGVRSLLIVVVGIGQAAGGADEVEGRKMEMVWRLVANPGGHDEKTYFENVVSQLMTILESATTASFHRFATPPATPAAASSSSSAPTTSRAVPPPPLPILQTTAYLLSHFVVARASPTFDFDFLRKRLFQSFLVREYRLESPNPKLRAPPAPVVVETDSLTLLRDLTTLSIWLHHAPPLPGLLDQLVTPITPLLFSLLSHLSRTAPTSAAQAKARRRSGKDASTHGDDLVEWIREEVKAILHVWGKGVEVREGIRGVWQAVEKWENGGAFGETSRGVSVGVPEGTAGGFEGGDWRAEWGADRDGRVAIVWKDESIEREAEDSTPTIVLPSVGSSESAPTTADLGLSPVSPDAVVDWLESLDRKEMSAGIFLRWLDEVRILREETDVEQMKRTITRLQLVLKMVERLGSAILTDPVEIIAFVAHALDVRSADATSHTTRAEVEATSSAGEAGGFGLDMLKIVPDDERLAPPNGNGGSARTNDPVEEREYAAEAGFGKDEMALTALTLLLAVLEANESLSWSSTPILRAIYSRLSSEDLASSASDLVPPLAREARMVLDLREASLAFSAGGSASTTHRGTAKGDDPLQESRERYREALKLLQDPMLPVRAQGLHILRSLVKPSSSGPSGPTSISPEQAPSQSILRTDPALLPAILSIFISSLTEDDSFLYLNAVQGLSSLVDVFGRQVIGGLVDVYSGHTAGGSRTNKIVEVREVGEGDKGAREVDKRLRVGEALVQVVQRSGEALGTLLDVLLPTLLSTLRASFLPIPLRASSITILATAVEVAPVAMMPVLTELGEAMRTLLEVETISFRQAAAPSDRPSQKGTVDNGKGKGKADEKSSGLNSRPSGRVLIEEISDDGSDLGSEDDEPIVNPFEPSATSKLHSVRPEEMADPTTTSSDHPSLRRAALLFLGLLVRTSVKARYDAIERAEDEAYAGLGESLQRGKLRMPGERLVELGKSNRSTVAETDFEPKERERLRITLGYVNETDRDELVRFQAGQVLEEMDEAGL